MSLALMLVLAQAPLLPLSGPARFPSQGTWTPPVLGRVSAAYDDGGWAVAWADQRRFPGPSTNPSDVWVARPDISGTIRYLEGSALTAPPESRNNAFLASNGNNWLLGWSEEDGGGWSLRAQTSLTRDLAHGWSPDSLVADAGWFDHGSDVVAGSGGEWRLAWRRPDGGLWVHAGATGWTQTTSAPPTALSLTAVPGDFLLAWFSLNTLSTARVGMMESTSGPITLLGLPNRLSTSAQVPNVVHQNNTGDLNFYSTTSGLMSLSGLTINNTNPGSPLLSTAFQNSTLIVYADGSSARLRLVSDANNGTAVPFSPAGRFVALASNPGLPQAVLAELPPEGLGVQVIGLDPTTTTLDAGPFIPFPALSAPQLRPTVAWSEVRGAFVVMWDEFVPPNASTLRYALLLPDGTTSPPQAVIGSRSAVIGGAAPRLIPALPGSGLPLGLLHLEGDGGQKYSELNETTMDFASSRVVPSNIRFAVRGGSPLAWGLTGGRLNFYVNWSLVGGGLGSMSRVPRCAARRTNQYIVGVSPGSNLSIYTQDGGTTAFPAAQPSFNTRFQHCYAARPGSDLAVVAYVEDDAGIQLVSVEAPTGPIIPPQPGSGSPMVTPLGSSLLVSWIEAPWTVRGFIVYPDAGVETPISFAERTDDPREHWAASGPNGSAAVVWQSFDVASGRVLINARLIYETRPAFMMDGGARDGGPVSFPDAGRVDAGPADIDASVIDAGVIDAGLIDAGLIDADAGPVDRDAGSVDGGLTPSDGGVDAGPADAGAPDAGPNEQPAVFVPVCGCDGATGAPLLLLAVMLIRRRGRAPSI